MDSRYSYSDLMQFLRYLEKNVDGAPISITFDDRKNLEIKTKNNKLEEVKIVLFKINGDDPSRMATITEENWLKSKV